jgi:hypothetical protein
MRVLFILALVLCASAPAVAQIQNIPGTGCAGASPTLIGGTPTLGSTLTVRSDQFPCNSPQTWGFVLASITCNTAPPVPWSCNASFNPCSVVHPIDAMVIAPISAQWSVTIPAVPALVGASLCVQGGCFTTFLLPPGVPVCFSPLHQAARITIQ